MFRKQEYTEKVEYIPYTPEKFFNENPKNNKPQEKSNIRFYVDSTNKVSPNDWYNSYFEVHFKIDKLADGTTFTNTANQRGSLAGDAYSLINKIDINFNGANVTSLIEINHCVNALNMLQFSGPYVNGPGTQSFTYPRISSVGLPLEEDTEFLKKVNLTNDKRIVESNILLNRYPFFESFKEKLCPLGKMEIIVNIEKDDTLIWIQGANKGRVIITKLILWVPKLELTDLGKKNYYNTIINPEKWTFNKISFEYQGNTVSTQGIFNITNAITKPRYVIMWALRIVKFSGATEQNYNPFTYNNYSLGNTENITCTSAQLIAGNDNFYPIQPLNPNNQLSVLYKKAIDFASNGNLLTGTFMTMNQYKRFYPLFVFDLTKQEN